MSETAPEAGDTAYELFRRGSAFLAEGHPAQAALLLRRAAALAPGKNSIREAWARACFAAERFDQAAALFEEVVKAAPTNDYAHFALGCSLVKLKRLAEARRHLRLAVAMRPDEATYRQRLLLCEARIAREDGPQRGEA